MDEHNAYAEHVPVLRDEFVEAIFSDPDGRYVDCTFGRGGHSRELLSRLSENGRLLALDRDPEAIAAGEILAQQDSRFTIVHTDFAKLGETLDSRDWLQVTGIGFDLGVSSPQVDQAQRGFSFRQDGPLDMRMDTSSGQPLSRMLEHVSERELIDVLRSFGDERYAQRIARSILKAKHDGTLNTTADLENCCFHAVPKPARYGSTHPATRTFQALRIWVNDEMGQIDCGITAAIDHLQPGGHLAVISFHSGEDRRIRDLVEAEVHACTCPPQMPVCVCGRKPTMRWLQKKPVRAGEQELAGNPRSRSSMLRVAQRLTDAEALKLAGYAGGVH
ncbi:MAG: 16S rRNA (cytosine(1402)-N(4))-methyltransferase RsmH [Zetaproteobacteria bacterium CG12_big_fil_rev_8_21_14_0_65_54_13]|nr:MAG: methyltransferase [Zetaproteobacteria bacterium CG23_combo_of_CG06-09_8_20_14_all_54_7]PIW44028.1 MAG: 16S rRNA (cytosine(1402)-N(4))-methyltransferase RsmH [Zetaproteobacteria bacterium CG12_big_fil_rev_8_21_14_0_65_54_13]PIX54361.1 MAG: 16S rRNA (cytosine(1402)-N(4))-methyltransferase RsmH [Zetaproteobacteria bacterium CG_4_10_14_3_um_filter_54_28]PJA28564.1 MAG: 16S rRNA (cytosine(1402)-N(4))-methyltransferase RsmH [Zetaproteobacteria bacterium CG_4_9_14_3_um_filter_54_145]